MVMKFGIISITRRPFFFFDQSDLICLDFHPPNGHTLSQITCLLKIECVKKFNFFYLIKFNRLIKLKIKNNLYFMDVPTYLELGNLRERGCCGCRLYCI
jgi:hypothetical protein